MGGLTAAQQAYLDRNKRPTTDNVGLFPQVMSGINRGIAGTVGLPADLMVGIAHDLVKGANYLTPDSVGDIPWKDGPLPSQNLYGAMQGLGMATTAAPDTQWEKRAARVGEEVGGYVIPTGAMMKYSMKYGKQAALALTQAISGGSMAAWMNEKFPGNKWADLAGSIIGGLTPAAVAHIAATAPKAITATALQDAENTAWDRFRTNDVGIRPQAMEGLASGLKTYGEGQLVNPGLTPKAASAIDSLVGRYGPVPARMAPVGPQNFGLMSPEGTVASTMRPAAGGPKIPPSLVQLNQERRIVGENVSGAKEPGERRLGVGIQNEISKTMDNLTKDDFVGVADPEAALAQLKQANALSQRRIQSEDLTNRLDAGELRADVTGLGGNTVNAMRQKVAFLLDPLHKERLSGYKQWQIDAMTKFAEGSRTANVLRFLASISPFKSGGMFGYGGGAVALGGTTGHGLLAAAPFAGSAVFHAAGDQLAKRTGRKLVESFREGKPIEGKPVAPLVRGAVASTAISGMANKGQGPTKLNARIKQMRDMGMNIKEITAALKQEGLL